MTNIRNGRLVGISYESRGYWNFQCDCGKIVTARSSHVRAGKISSCGCYKSEDTTKRNNARKRNIVGLKFNRLTVIKIVPGVGYEVQCDCGNIVIIRQKSCIVRGRSKSCGCLNREEVSKVSTIHGWSHHYLYQTWKNMMRRCYNPASHRYKSYGGRGITVCEQWHDVSKFCEDILELLGERPDGMSLDRPDNDGTYEPRNVRWATVEQQRWNR